MTATVPVLLDEALAALAIDPDGTYVDATFGRGGARSRDPRPPRARGAPRRDRPRPAAEAAARGLSDSRFEFVRAWFSEIPATLAARDIVTIDGALLDLGISSPQIDDPERGFSLRGDGPLDMRMDPTRGESAAAFPRARRRARIDGGDTRLW
jgi:16S rRNA (cytosine1402-N4)-methyltransferase